MESERAILDVLFPKVRAEVFRLLFSSPLKQRYVRELTNMSGLALCTVQDELRKLSAVGLLISWTDQRRRFYRANRDHPLFPELLRFVQLSARLPRTRHSALHRRNFFVTQKKRRGHKAGAFSKNLPTNWHLFSRANKRSTA